jgi:ferritin-like protein
MEKIKKAKKEKIKYAHFLKPNRIQEMGAKIPDDSARPQKQCGFCRRQVRSSP